MNRRRLALLAAGTALTAAATVGASAVQADTPRPEVRTSGSDYWACAGLETVDIATCLESPIPDLSGLPPLRQIIYDLTGVPISG